MLVLKSVIAEPKAANKIIVIDEKYGDNNGEKIAVTTINYKELNDGQEPESVIYAEYLHNCIKVVSKIALNLGKRGITDNGLVSDIGANGCKNKRAGWYSYYLTPAAFDKFKKTNSIVLNLYLD